jgi:hypothetical protein
MAKELRKIELPTGTYYVDYKLLQLRNVDNPSEFINFNRVSAMEDYLSLQVMKERMVRELTT